MHNSWAERRGKSGKAYVVQRTHTCIAKTRGGDKEDQSFPLADKREPKTARISRGFLRGTRRRDTAAAALSSLYSSLHFIFMCQSAREVGRSKIQSPGNLCSRDIFRRKHLSPEISPCLRAIKVQS